MTWHKNCSYYSEMARDMAALTRTEPAWIGLWTRALYTVDSPTIALSFVGHCNDLKVLRCRGEREPADRTGDSDHSNEDFSPLEGTSGRGQISSVLGW